MLPLHDPTLHYFFLTPFLISDAVSTKPAVITLFRTKTYLYCPVVKETIQQDSVIWDVLDKPSAQLFCDIRPLFAKQQLQVVSSAFEQID